MCDISTVLLYIMVLAGMDLKWSCKRWQILMTLIIKFVVALRLTRRKVVKITGPKYTSLLQMQCQQIM